MLIRNTTDASFECISQEQHALVSGALAAAWNPTRLDPMLVQLIGAHDNAWRASDAQPLYNPATGLPFDFINYPMAPKIALYRRGVDMLEDVDPWLASMVSKHYCTFAGTLNIEGFQQTEAARRARLAELIAPGYLAQKDDALRWLKFFDIFSLALCLTGPGALRDAIPRWLQDPDAWSRAPDGHTVRIRWRSDARVEVDNWPFAPAELSLRLNPRVLTQKFMSQDALDQSWGKIPMKMRDILLQPAGR